MRSLSYLNGQSSATVTYTDTRDANVIFDRPDPLDYTFTGTDTTFSVIVGTNIIEIVQPSQTNIRMKVNAGTTQATVNWPTIPVGCTVTQVDTVFTLSGIDSLQDWEFVKSPTITLDADFFGTVNYSVEILYDTPTQANKSVRFTVGQYVPAVEMNASASVSCAVGKIVDPELQFEAIATTSRLLAILATTAFIDSEATLEAECELVILFDAEVDANASIQAGITYAPAQFISTINANASIQSNISKLVGLSNRITRNYNSNQSNKIFEFDTPQIETNFAYAKVQLSSSNGEFGTTTSKNSIYEIQGTISQVNALISDIIFYPTYNFNSNTTFNWKQYYSNDNINFNLHINQDFTLNHIGTGSVSRSYVFSSSGSHTWTPTIEEIEYGNMDYLVVSAGGNANSRNGGGGGLGRYELNQSISQSSYSVYVGVGGGDSGSGEKSVFNGLDPDRGIIASTFRGGIGGGQSGGVRFQGGYEYDGGTFTNGGGGGGAGSGGNDAVSTAAGTGGAGLSFDSVGFGSTTYGYGGNGSTNKAGVSVVNTSTTPGSGGGHNSTTGQDGLVWIKVVDR
jgi:hypothetical protein